MNLCCLTFWFINSLFRAYFHKKKFRKKSWPKIYIGQDPDPDPVKIVRIRNTAIQKSGQVYCTSAHSRAHDSGPRVLEHQAVLAMIALI
jgi:hypothetical protein